MITNNVKSKIAIIYLLLFFFACNNQGTLNIHSSLEIGLEHAKIDNNKVLLVFDSYGNPNNSVKKLLSDKDTELALRDLVVVVLNIDEPSDEGEKNKALQFEKFGTNVQPTFYLLDHNGVIISGPLGYCNSAALLKFIG